jgi:hypothetical protein
MSGAGDPSRAEDIAHIPIWAFHGEADPIGNSQDMIDALEIARGEEAVYTHCKRGDCSGLSQSEVEAALEAGTQLLFTEYENAGHVVWAESYDHPKLIPWVFAQKQGCTEETALNYDSSATVDNGSCIQDVPVLRPDYLREKSGLSFMSKGNDVLKIYSLNGSLLMRVTGREIEKAPLSGTSEGCCIHRLMSEAGVSTSLLLGK